MAYNKARAEKKWLRWKNAEKKQLLELGIDEEIIQRMHRRAHKRLMDWTE